MVKNEEFVVDIIDYGANGEGIAKINGYTVFVVNALKGEKCKIHILKVLKNYAYAKIVEVVVSSDNRLEPDCNTYARCGGCNLRHIKYEETLKIKQEKVENLANKMLDKPIKINETIGMEAPVHYRNKAIFPVSPNGELGMYAERTHNIIPIQDCKIQTKKSQEIAKYIVENWTGTFYNEKTGNGILRNIMIREGFSTNEIMVVIVQTSKENMVDVEKLVQKFPDIKTVVLNINDKNTNVVLSRENVVIYGKGFITDKLGEYTFKISPNSFYQINPVQTEKIYNLAIREAELKKSDIICDLYCGIGTIGIFASKYVEKVYGVEIVEEAINDAKENAKINNINNTEFMVGDVETAFGKLIKQNVKPNVVFVDPPRKGLDNKTIENLCSLKLEKLIYISCNQATLMRDLQLLSKTYDIKEITPIDNFCYTSHVECVAMLYLKQDR